MATPTYKAPIAQSIPQLQATLAQLQANLELEVQSQYSNKQSIQIMISRVSKAQANLMQAQAAEPAKLAQQLQDKQNQLNWAQEWAMAELVKHSTMATTQKPQLNCSTSQSKPMSLPPIGSSTRLQKLRKKLREVKEERELSLLHSENSMLKEQLENLQLSLAKKTLEESSTLQKLSEMQNALGLIKSSVEEANRVISYHNNGVTKTKAKTALSSALTSIRQMFS